MSQRWQVLLLLVCLSLCLYQYQYLSCAFLLVTSRIKTVGPVIPVSLRLGASPLGACFQNPFCFHLAEKNPCGFSHPSPLSSHIRGIGWKRERALNWKCYNIKNVFFLQHFDYKCNSVVIYSRTLRQLVPRDLKIKGRWRYIIYNIEHFSFSQSLKP